MSNLIALLRRLVAPVLVLALVAGCSSPEPGSTEWQPLKGTLVAVESADVATLTSAATTAMKAMGLKPMVTQSDAFSTLIVGSIVVGSLPQERDLTVTVNRLTDTTAEITFHIAFTRSREKLDVLLGEIRKRLPAPAAAPKSDAAPQPEKPAPAPKPDATAAAPQPEKPAPAPEPQPATAAPQPK